MPVFRAEVSSLIGRIAETLWAMPFPSDRHSVEKDTYSAKKGTTSLQRHRLRKDRCKYVINFRWKAAAAERARGINRGRRGTMRTAPRLMFNKGVGSGFRGRIGSGDDPLSFFLLPVVSGCKAAGTQRESLNLIKKDKSSVNHAARRKWWREIKARGEPLAFSLSLSVLQGGIYFSSFRSRLASSLFFAVGRSVATRVPAPPVCDAQQSR